MSKWNMDNLEKDIWELVTKYHLNIDYIRLKVDQMIMEYELAIQSGIAWIEYNDMMKQKKIRIFGKK